MRKEKTLQEFISSPVLWIEMFLFIVAQVAAVAVYLQYLSLVPEGISESASQSMDAIYFLAAFFIVSVLMFLILKSRIKKYIVPLFLYLALFNGLYIFLNAWVSPWYAFVISVIALVLYFLVYTVAIHNFIFVVALSGIGVVIGVQLSIATALIIMLALSVYDYWAVLRSQYMTQLFTGMAKLKVVYALIIPKNISDLKQSVRLLSISPRYAFLGTGDVIMPMLLLIPALNYSPRAGLGVIIGSSIGLLVLNYYAFMATKQRPLPGLPFIVTGSIIGFLFALL